MSDKELLALSNCHTPRGACQIYTTWSEGGSVLTGIKIKRLCKYHVEKK